MDDGETNTVGFAITLGALLVLAGLCSLLYCLAAILEG